MNEDQPAASLSSPTRPPAAVRTELLKQQLYGMLAPHAESSRDVLTSMVLISLIITALGELIYTIQAGMLFMTVLLLIGLPPAMVLLWLHRQGWKKSHQAIQTVLIIGTVVGCEPSYAEGFMIAMLVPVVYATAVLSPRWMLGSTMIIYGGVALKLLVVDQVPLGPTYDILNLITQLLIIGMLAAASRIHAQLVHSYHRINHKLEAEVRARTIQLTQALQEAEQSRDLAQAASRAKSTFLANVSHELRTPLNAIIGYSEMLQESPAVQHIEYAGPRLERIHSAGQHLLVLINELLDLSKVEAEKLDLLPDAVEVQRLISEVVPLAQPLAERSNSTLTVQMSPTPIFVMADHLRLKQILLNLLSNACKFTSDGSIALDVRAEQDEVIFELADTGEGIPEELQSLIFEPFTQSPTADGRSKGGTGLGLAISRQLARLMGGDITVASTPGVGSTFTLRLPLHRPVERRPADGTGIPLLVIDDDAQIRSYLSRLLEQDGYRVLTAMDGDEGLALARAHRPRAILLDIMMEGRNGWSVLNAVKADPQLQDVPVIMISMQEDQVTATALGADSYLTKPIDTRRVRELLATYAHSDAAPHVLIAEDDDATSMLLQAVIQRQGWQTTHVATGREALEALERITPSLLLLDLMMPEMDGFQVLERVRQHPTWHDLPVVILTAMDLGPHDYERLTASAQRVLQKAGQSNEKLLGVLHRYIDESG